jgi:hypothetical protein
MPWYAWLWCIAMAAILLGIVKITFDIRKIAKDMKPYL